MMESSNQSHEVREEPIEEEDPLLELARIVSGEDLEKPSQPKQPNPQYGHATPVAPAADPVQELVSETAQGMSAADAEELTQDLEGSLEDMLADGLTTEAVTAEFEESLAELGYDAGDGHGAASAPEAQVEAAHEPVAQVEPEHTDPELESSFTVDLEEELNAELEAANMAHEEPVVQQASMEPGFYSAPVDRAAVAEAMAEPSFQSAEPAPEAYQPEISPDFVSDHTEEADAADVSEILERAAASHTTGSGHADSGDDDLGDIFAAEFEQITAEHSAAQMSAESALEAALLNDEIGTGEGELSFLNNRAPVSQGYSSGSAFDDIEDIDKDLEAEFGAAFEASEARHEQINLEAEFASAFGEELEQNKILPANEIHDIAWDEKAAREAELEFAAAMPGAAAAAGHMQDSANPEHLTDPTLLDDPNAQAGVYAEGEASGGNNGMKMAAVALGVALFAGLGAVSYGYMTGEQADTGPIVVKADEGPVKVKPADPGGRQVANQDKASFKKVAGDSEGTDQTELVSTKETARVIGLNEEPETLPTKVGERLEPVDEQVAEVKTAMAPKKVRTFTVKPDGTIIAPDPIEETPQVEETAALNVEDSQVAELNNDETAQDTRSLEPVVTEETTVDTATETAAVEVAQPEPETATEETGGIEGASTVGGIGIPTPSPLPKPVVKAQPKPVAAAKPKPEPEEPVQIANLSNSSAGQSAPSSAWVVQISSQRSQEAAESSLRNLKSRFGSLLNDRQTNIREAVVSGKGTFYRVRVNTQSREDAGRFCERYKSAGGSCFVTR